MEKHLKRNSFLAKHISSDDCNDMFYTPTEELAGWPGVVHGGLQMLLLSHLVDEHLNDLPSVACQNDYQRIVIRYHQPVRTNQTYQLHVSDVDHSQNELSINSSIRDTKGTKLTQAIFEQSKSNGQDRSETGSEDYNCEDMDISWNKINQWPIWQTCCLNPIQKHMNVDVGWHYEPRDNLLAGQILWPEMEGFFKPAAMGLALMDQGLGFCGQRDGCSMLLSIRLEMEMRQTPMPGEEVVLVCQGKRRSSKTYNARAKLLLGTSLVAQGSAMFRTY